LNQVEKAKIKDIKQMHKLINYFAGKDEMLPRPLSELYEHVRDYFVIKEGEEVIACAALHVTWSDLSEIKALAVAEENQRQQIGGELVEACIAEAKILGIPQIFCLTYKPAFFEKHGFVQVDKSTLPRKIWAECYNCPKFPDCNEVALIYDFKEEP